MASHGWTTAVINAPARSLLVLFLGWKLLLLAIVLASPGPGYDTSTQLLLHGHGIGRSIDADHFRLRLEQRLQFSGGGSLAPVLASVVERLVARLTRWDAIYFASIAERGYQLEQEWAFGWGFTRLLAVLAQYFPITTSRLHDVILHGIALANVSHLLSVLLVYRLACALPLGPKERKPTFALIAAGLYVLSPAGVFLVAPFTEAPFALLNIAGHLFYVYSWGPLADATRAHGFVQDGYLLLAGACFGLAATVRGNGVLSGILFFHDAVLWFGLLVERCLGVHILNLRIIPQDLQAELRSLNGRRIPTTILAGILTAVGLVTPQVIAYLEYCGANERPWCRRFPPSIFTFVQAHYWNNGFLKYWTPSNIPLFLLAGPVLATLIRSSWLAFTGHADRPHSTPTPQMSSDAEKRAAVTASANLENLRRDSVLVRIGLVQLALASLALTSFHVQIVNRISSGYPAWYLLLAKELLEGQRSAGWLVRWMVAYAVVQAVLFASFLPPA